MNSVNNISDAGIYTDFGGLSRLKTKAASASGSEDSKMATKEVAKQFESVFLQMMLKSMRDASQIGESSDSDQTQFYMEMFDKQIALDLANSGNGIGMAEMLERDLNGGAGSSDILPVNNLEAASQTNQSNKQDNQQQAFLLEQIQRPGSAVHHNNSAGDK